MSPAYYSDGTVKWDDRTGSTSQDGLGYQQPWKEIGAPGANQLFDDSISNVLDKFVFVENTGGKDAYVRTVFAFEKGNFTVDDYNDKLVHLNRNTETDGTTWKWTPFSEEMKATIEGTEYYLTVATYNRGDGVVKPGEITRPSLLQVFFDSTVKNEHIKALGDTYNILAISQAVQADMGDLTAAQALDKAFGAITATSHPWVDGIKVGFEVSNDAELADAINAGETEIWLNEGTYHAPKEAKGKTLTLNGTKNSILEVVPTVQAIEANGQLDYNFDGSTVTFNGVTIKTNSQLYAGYARMSGTYNNCVIQNTYNLGLNTVNVFNNCEINITNEYLRVNGAKSAEFNNCTFNTDGRAILVFQDGSNHEQTVTVKDCTFNATAGANTWNGIHVAAVSIDGTSGTYVVNLEGTNTVDSDMNGLWQIKTGEANVTVNE